MDISLSTELVIVIVCLIFSGFFSASETALTSLSELKVKHLLEEKGKKAKDLELWLLHPNKVLNTILIGNNVVNIFGSIVAADLAEKYFGNSQIALTTGVMTFLVLIFGEITPKTFAKHNAEILSIIFIKLLKVFYKLFYPITFTLNMFVKLLIKIMGGKLENDKPKITEDEIEFLINVGEEEGVLENQKKEMLHNIFEISDTLVKEIMVPRTEMVVIRIDQDINEILDVVIETEYSRIPVYEGKMDNIIGILYTKDLIKELRKSSKDVNLKNILRKPYFVPETKKIDDLLREFQSKHIHLAIVIDEYGGVAGLVTLEDVIEEIVGEIRDEFDKEEEDKLIKLSDDTFIIDPLLDIDDFCEYFKLEKDESMDDYETVGGLIYFIAGKIPEIGEEYIYKNFKFKVLEKSGKKLEKLELKIIGDNSE
ncbi:magnesium/cobalt efflux protein [Deferribacter desulfuricans SSM1]|uniref:Magnesium/cobalt efflux protein n=1 Tax=Deferribacter desulfuricans (strain DSM 14783 / JCM 11476 / NBRC 101012 / SSM1) TaxID=639282 RepID=D3PD77_DEFDS|nr:hemolysin family protein [Deferribacter desulfuricans]BAI80550.1 magnesium/cobalt efflux protein [Deferribacter desulfuricans SSM1]